MTKLSGVLEKPFFVEYVAPGIISERSADGLLSILTVDNGNSTTINAWLDCARTTFLNWPIQLPCYSLHDLRRAGSFAYKADVQGRLREVLVLRQDLQRSIAVALTAERSDERAFSEQSINDLGLDCEYQVFLTRHQAVAWLLRERQSPIQGLPE